MAKTSRTIGFEKLEDPEKNLVVGPGRAPSKADLADGTFTTGQVVVIAGNRNPPKSDEGAIELDVRAILGQWIDAAKRQSAWNLEIRLSGDQT